MSRNSFGAAASTERITDKVYQKWTRVGSHLAVITLAPQPAHKSSLQVLGVEPIRLGPVHDPTIQEGMTRLSANGDDLAVIGSSA